MLLLAEVSITGLKVHTDDTPTYLLIPYWGYRECIYPQGEMFLSTVQGVMLFRHSEPKRGRNGLSEKFK